MKKYASRVQPAQTRLYFQGLLSRRTLLSARLLTFCYGGLSVFGCAGRAHPSETSFAAIQRDEAEMARALAALDVAPSCDAAQRAATAVCDARRTLCERVRESDDADAQAHCRRASDLCIAASQRSRARCADAVTSVPP